MQENSKPIQSKHKNIHTQKKNIEDVAHYSKCNSCKLLPLFNKITIATWTQYINLFSLILHITLIQQLHNKRNDYRL